MSNAARKAQRRAEVARRKVGQATQRQEQQPPRQEEPATALEILHQQQVWSGPIPSPQDLQLYKSVGDDLPERIVVMAERQLDLVQTQQEHRIEMEDMHVRGLNRRADVGLWMAFALALVVLVGGMYLVYEGHDEAGTAIITIDLVGLVGVFIYGRRDQARQEQQPK